MNHQQKLEAIRREAIKVNHEIENSLCKHNLPHHCANCDNDIGPTIGLSDVLMLARSVSERIQGQLFVDDTGSFCIAKVGKSLDHLAQWNLLLPLHLQDEPTVSFLFDLLA